MPSGKYAYPDAEFAPDAPRLARPSPQLEIEVGDPVPAEQSQGIPKEELFRAGLDFTHLGMPGGINRTVDLLSKATKESDWREDPDEVATVTTELIGSIHRGAPPERAKNFVPIDALPAEIRQKLLDADPDITGWDMGKLPKKQRELLAQLAIVGNQERKQQEVMAQQQPPGQPPQGPPQGPPPGMPPQGPVPGAAPPVAPGQTPFVEGVPGASGGRSVRVLR